MTPITSASYESVVHAPAGVLRQLIRRGETPDPANLVGFEYRGTNMPVTTRLAGLRRFIKGFELADDGSVVGYNKQVSGADLSTPWTPRPQRDGRVGGGAAGASHERFGRLQRRGVVGGDDIDENLPHRQNLARTWRRAGTQ